MNKSNLVFRFQFAQFKRERGMMVFYCLSVLIIGIIVPLFLRRIESSLTMAALLTAMFLKPILSDSLTGEREHRTLETLLSSPINGKSIIWGKALFSLCFALFFFGLTALFTALVSWLISNDTAIALWQWTGIIVVAIFIFSAIAIAGVHASATSADTRAANTRVSRIVYPFGLLFTVYITVVATIDYLPAFIVGLILVLICLGVIVVYAIKVLKMRQSDYFENLKVKKTAKAQDNYASPNAPNTQFGIIMRFEVKYLMTLKMLLLNFGVLCVCPLAIVCIMTYYTGIIDLNYAALLTVLAIPRVPTNLIAYSIGGEKVYKTGESLLSTPLHIRPIFLAKCAVPVLVSAIMLLTSALLTLMGLKIISWILPDIGEVYRYTASQLVLIFPVGIMASMMMMFISAILSAILKTPRHGLFATSLISFLFVIPVLAIIYLTQNTLMWSLIYFAVLLIGNTVCIWNISDKISRPQIMSWL